MDVEHFLGLIVLTGAVLGVVTTYVKYGKKMWSILKPRLTVPSRLTKVETLVGALLSESAEIKNTLNLVFEEVKTNGHGHTLRAAIHRETENRWRYYEIDGKAIWETGMMQNGEFGCIRATEGLSKLAGQSPLGAGWLNAIHPDDLEEVTEDWERAVEYRLIYDRLQRFVHRDERGKIEKIVYVRSFFRPEYNERGEFSGGLGQCFPMTKQEFDDALSRAIE